MQIESLSLLQLLAILSASAAGGMRIGIPLLIIGLINLDRLWTDVPLLSLFPPQLVLVMLTSWSLFELIGSKKLIGLRILQQIQLILSPLIGGIIAIGVARLLEVKFSPLWLLGIFGGIFALILKFIQVGWFFRLGKIPISIIILEDFLSVILVIFAFQAPENGGLIGLLLLWIALRSSTDWKYYSQRSKSKQRENNT